MTQIEIDSTGSTNTWTAQHAAELPSMTMVSAVSQTQGRGQRGNVWESEPGKNLTFSVLVRPEGVPAREQFAISEATALAVADLLEAHGMEAKVKWPNDIYIGHRKVCGILIEHAVMGTGLMHSILGVGLNVNQTYWYGDAPNPVSMAMAASTEFDLASLRTEAARLLETRLQQASTPQGRAELHSGFMHRLYRGDSGFHPWRRTADGQIFEARIVGVGSQGLLQLEDTCGARHEYTFKEIEHILPQL